VPDILVPEWAQLGWLIHKACQESFETGASIYTTWPMVVSKRHEIVEEEVTSSWPNVKIPFQSIPPLTTAQLVRAKAMCATFDRFHTSMRKVDWFETECLAAIIV
jgi:hypothetical protein